MSVRKRSAGLNGRGNHARRIFTCPGAYRASRFSGLWSQSSPVDLRPVSPCSRSLAAFPIRVTSINPQSVIVIGAGPAGLTTAYRLASLGYRVTLLYQSKTIGEHFRCEDDAPLSILGCHKATWTLLYALGVLPMPPVFMEASLEFLVPDGMLARYPHS